MHFTIDADVRWINRHKPRELRGIYTYLPISISVISNHNTINLDKIAHDLVSIPINSYEIKRVLSVTKHLIVLHITKL